MKYTTKVTVKHWRISDSLWWNQLQKEKGAPKFCWLVLVNRSKDHLCNSLAPKGGKTEVVIHVFDEHGDPLEKFCGVAYCSMKDNFCYRIGRNIAFGRALKQLDEWRNSFAAAHPEYKSIQV